ncbi:hypothetical protein Tco_0480066, partial [Tanacetum coccineum]
FVTLAALGVEGLVCLAALGLVTLVALGDSVTPHLLVLAQFIVLVCVGSIYCDVRNL